MITAAFILVLILFSIYGLLVSFEIGMLIAMIFPKLSNKKSIDNLEYTPLWEITNVFLIFGTTAFAVFFNNGLVSVSTIAFGPLAVAALGLLIRAVFGMYIFYSHRNIGLISKYVHLLATFTTPLSISIVGINLFTGKPVLKSATGIFLLIATFLGLKLIGLSFVNRYKNSITDRTKYSLYLLFTVWVIDLGFLLPMSLRSSNELILRTPLTILSLSIAVCTVSYFLYSAIKKKEYELYAYVSLLGFIVPILIGIDLRPYLINGTLTIAQAYGAKAYQNSIVIATLVCLPVVALGTYLLVRLLIDNNKSKDIPLAETTKNILSQNKK